MKNEEILQILSKGILAPSADNLQPWNFLSFPDRSQIDLFFDSERIRNFCDEGLKVPSISAGAVIENIRLEAAYLGYGLEIDYFPVPADPMHAATLRFQGASATPHFGRDASTRRHTNRKFYTSSAIPTAVLERASSLVSEEPGFRFHWIGNGEPRYKTLTRLVGDADQLRFEAERLHRELYNLIRWSPEEAEKTSDGLDARVLEAGLGGTCLFKLIASWKRLACLNKFGISRLFNFYAQRQMASSSGAGFLTAPSQRLTDYMRGGELMQRLWMLFNSHQLALQPMEALPIAVINLQTAGGKDWTDSQRNKLRVLKDEFFSLYGIGDETGLIFLFRMGQAPAPRVSTRRRPLQSFLLNFDDAGSKKLQKGRSY